MFDAIFGVLAGHAAMQHRQFSQQMPEIRCGLWRRQEPARMESAAFRGIRDGITTVSNARGGLRKLTPEIHAFVNAFSGIYATGSANHAVLRSRCTSVSPSWKIPVLTVT